MVPRVGKQGLHILVAVKVRSHVEAAVGQAKLRQPPGARLLLLVFFRMHQEHEPRTCLHRLERRAPAQGLRPKNTGNTSGAPWTRAKAKPRCRQGPYAGPPRLLRASEETGFAFGALRLAAIARRCMLEGANGLPLTMIEEKLESLGIVLPPTPAPLANYVPFAITGNLLFLAGQGPKEEGGDWFRGKVGEEVGLEEAYRHARLNGIRLLSVTKAALGSLDRVQRVVKVVGFVNSAPTFRDHPKVINGCSDLFVEVFGDLGRHARSAVGVSSLPEGITVEVEAVLEFR